MARNSTPVLRGSGVLILAVLLTSGALRAQPVADYGDAPDNTLDASLEAYPGVAGRFPSLFATANAAVADNRGVHHRNPQQVWLATPDVTEFSTTLEADAKVATGDEDDAQVDVFCVVPAAPAPPALPGPPLCYLHVVAVHVDQEAQDRTRYLNALVDVNRDGRWRSASPFGSFPREHVIVNRTLDIPPGTTRRVISGPFALPALGTQTWVRVTLSRLPVPVADADDDGIPDAGWDGSVPEAGFQFGETEDHLVTPVVVPVINPPKEPPSHFRLLVVPNPVPVPPGTFQVQVLRTRSPGNFRRATGFILRLGGCETEGDGNGIDIPAPMAGGFVGGIANDLGSIRNAAPGLPPNNCGPPPCVDRSANFGPASYGGPPDRRITRCRVALKVDPDGEVAEYDYPFNIDVPVNFLEADVPDEDGDGVSDLADLCDEDVDPLQIEDLDGYRDDDGCKDRDNDGDTVLDEDDFCPLDLEDLDGFADGDGCPDPKTARLPLEGVGEGGEVSVVLERAGVTCTARIVTARGETAAAIAVRLAAAVNADTCSQGQDVRASASDGILFLTGGELREGATRIVAQDAGFAPARVCDLDVVPAATLLFPYFEVELDDPTGATTLLSVSNAGPESRLVQVTLWTDWAVPTLRFPIYLTGFDVQSLDLRSLLVAGRLPSTGTAVSHRGNLSGPNADFPGCNASSEPGAPPVFANPALDAATRAHLQAWHVGARSPMTGNCAGADHGDAVARGYVTVDVVNSCSLLSPADEGYFAAGGSGVAANRNALFGEHYLVRPGENFAQGEQAVHIRAAEGVFKPGDATFYGRYVGATARDARQPLPRAFAARFLEGGVFDGTELLVWRDTNDRVANAVACGSRPRWAPLAERETIAFDEAENAQVLPAGTRFPWATQRVDVGGADLPVVPLFGRLDLDLDHSAAEPSQGWVTVLTSALGRFSVGFRAVTLESACQIGEPAVAATE